MCVCVCVCVCVTQMAGVPSALLCPALFCINVHVFGICIYYQDTHHAQNARRVVFLHPITRNRQGKQIINQVFLPSLSSFHPPCNTRSFCVYFLLPTSPNPTAPPPTQCKSQGFMISYFLSQCTQSSAAGTYKVVLSGIGERKK